MKHNMMRNIQVVFFSAMLLSYACTMAPSLTTQQGQNSSEAGQVVDLKEKASASQSNEAKQVVQNLNDNKQNAIEKEQIADESITNDSGEQVSLISDNSQEQKNTTLNTTTSKAQEMNQPVGMNESPGKKNPNRFNRLLEKRRSLTDRLHDPNNPSLKYLQNSAEAFAEFPKDVAGNKVNWVKAVDMGIITPRHDLTDPSVKPIVMDLNIVMQVKGSMPDVVFPHRVHTRWLDCSNCHPAIFNPQSGTNKMSMADNLLGKRCGVCHGKVAFPLSACTKCHSNKKVVVKQKK